MDWLTGEVVLNEGDILGLVPTGELTAMNGPGAPATCNWKYYLIQIMDNTSIVTHLQGFLQGISVQQLLDYYLHVHAYN